MRKIAFALILIPALCFAGSLQQRQMNVLGMYSASGGGPSCSSGTTTGGVDHITATTTGGSTGITSSSSRGNSFQFASAQYIYSVSIIVVTFSTPDTIECRYDDDTDMSSEYLGSGTLALSSTGEKEIVFSSHEQLSGSTTYYFACAMQGATSQYIDKATEDYGSGARQDGDPWSLTGQSGDIRFKVSVCAD